MLAYSNENQVKMIIIKQVITSFISPKPEGA